MPIDNEPRLYRPGVYDRVGASSTVEALDATPGSRVDVGGFERITRSGRGDRGLGEAGEASLSGFDRLKARYQALTDGGRQAVIASAVGFLLLIPPGTGQLLHPGVPKASHSPLAMMTAEKADLPTGARLRGEVDQARGQVPQGGAGAGRKLAIREMIELHGRIEKLDRRLSGIANDAASMMAALSTEVGFDAKLGYGVDWYWFGVPPKHAEYHAGVTDNAGIQDHAQGVANARSYARATAREEISKLLLEESPEYRVLHGKYVHEKNRLEAATSIRGLAADASDALSTASHAITMRNLTPKTTTEPVYSTRTRKDGTTERVQTGTRTVPNPTWDMWNMAAIAAKGRAEGRIRELNGATTTHAKLLGMGGQGVPPDLIGVWDFFRQPSFGIWSFDSFDVDAAKGKVDSLRGMMDGMIVQIRRVHDPLKAEVEATIDARWNDLAGGNPTDDDERDPLARLRHNARRRPEDGPDWEPEGPTTR